MKCKLSKAFVCNDPYSPKTLFIRLVTKLFAASFSFHLGKRQEWCKKREVRGIEFNLESFKLEFREEEVALQTFKMRK